MQIKALYSHLNGHEYLLVHRRQLWDEVGRVIANVGILFWVAPDEKLLRGIYDLPEDAQKSRIEEAGHVPIMSYNQTDFVKDRVAVEVQFGKYAFVAHDLFVKHLSFYVSEIIDVGIEILPMKELEREMSFGKDAAFRPSHWCSSA